MALAQWERERFNYGEAAGDGKGDPIRVHAIKAEHTEKLVYTWLSGGASEVRLPEALPITRGGTGATTVAGTLRNLGYFEDANHTLRRGVKVLSFGNTGMRDQFKNVPDASFSRVAEGHYRITGANLSQALWGIVIPQGPEGFMKAFVELNTSNNIIEIKTYYPDFSTWPPKLGAPMDLPPGWQVDLEIL